MTSFCLNILFSFFQIQTSSQEIVVRLTYKPWVFIDVDARYDQQGTDYQVDLIGNRSLLNVIAVDSICFRGIVFNGGWEIHQYDQMFSYKFNMHREKNKDRSYNIVEIVNKNYTGPDKIIYHIYDKRFEHVIDTIIDEPLKGYR